MAQKPAETAHKFDRAREEAYLDLLRQGFPKRMAARQIGISIRALNRRIQTDPAFAQEVFEAEMEAIETVEATAYRMAVSAENFNATRFFLINRNRDRWTGETKVQVTGPDGGPIRVEHSLDELREQAREVLGRLKVKAERTIEA